MTSPAQGKRLRLVTPVRRPSGLRMWVVLPGRHFVRYIRADAEARWSLLSLVFTVSMVLYLFLSGTLWWVSLVVFFFIAMVNAFFWGLREGRKQGREQARQIMLTRFKVGPAGMFEAFLKALHETDRNN